MTRLNDAPVMPRPRFGGQGPAAYGPPMATTDPRALGADHLDRIVEVTWQPQLGAKLVRTKLRGVLTRVAHDGRGTTIDVDLGPIEVTVNLDVDGGEVDLTDD